MIHEKKKKGKKEREREMKRTIPLIRSINHW
jgi:hypothetical protein